MFSNRKSSPASALLLAVMVISVLTTTTLGAIAIRFDQLTSTDKVTSAAKAKLATDSGLAKLKEKIAGGAMSFVPEAYDLTSEQSVSIGSSMAKFRPNPRHSIYSLESQVISLPRCLAVAVLSPWTNTGGYLLDQDDTGSNPALVFYYANIINDTPLGVIATNVDNQGGYTNAEKATPISELTKMGQFYNPYAPKGTSEANRAYWTVKLGGPDDQFLYRTDPTGLSSYYKGLDFVYIPYLPRFTDSGVLRIAGQESSGLVRKSGTNLRKDFEQLIKKNNFKVWLDASTTNDWLYQYGLGDLFTDAGDEQSRITWIQPSLWNDLPEGDSEAGYANGLAGPYTATNPGSTMGSSAVTWARAATPVKALAGSDAGWKAQIVRGSRSFSFLYPSGDMNRTLIKGGTISLNLYGSLEGLRLNQEITLTLLSKGDSRPIYLQNRDNSSQGKLVGARITSLVQDGSNVVTQITFGNTDYQTPLKLDANPIYLRDIAVIAIQAGPQLDTRQSVSALTLQADGRTVSLAGSDCPNTSTTFTVCPAVGDVVSLSKNGSKPVWGQVSSVDYTGTGRNFTRFTLDKFREMPRPLKDMASSLAFTDPADGKEKIAYYGGLTDANEFDGSVNAVSDELWFYTPASNSWEYIANVPVGNDPNNLPGVLSGASMSGASSNGLYIFGGYGYQAVGELTTGGAQPCGDNFYLNSCLAANRPGARVAKYLSNAMFRFDLTTRQWQKVTYDASNRTTPSIADGTRLELRVVSTLGDRSGKDGWQARAVVDTAGGNSPVNVVTTPGDATTLTLTTSSAGFAKGDEIYLSGTKTDGVGFLSWARVTDLPSSNTVTFRLYGQKPGTASPVSLKFLSLYRLARVKNSVTCSWSSANAGCTAVDTTGLGIGDGVVLEQYDDYANATRLTGSYSGYISRIAGNLVYFNSNERFGGFDDYKTGVSFGGESVRNLPTPRYGAQLGTSKDGSKFYLWQGDQMNTNVASRSADTWEYDVATSRWTIVAQPYTALPGGSLTIQTIRTAPSSTFFASTNTSGVNGEIVKDKQITWDNNGQQYTDYVWDDAKTWTIEVAAEGSSSWNAERVTEGSTVVIERLNNGSRERFTGTVVSINTGSQRQFTVKHNSSYSSDSGIKDNVANAKISTSYPDYRNTNALSVTNATRVDNDTIRVGTNDSATTLRKIPVGATVLVYSGSMSGVNTSVYTATIDNRIINGSNEVTLKAAGTRFMNGPTPQAYSAGALTEELVEGRMAVSWQNYRAKSTPGALEWVNDLTGIVNAKQWVVRVPTGYSLNGGDNRPSTRSDGMAAASPDRHDIFVAGGTYGTYGNLWKLQNGYRFIGSSWTFGKSSPTGSTDLPNLYGSSMTVLSSGNVVVFNGKRRFDSSTQGPRVLAESNSSSRYDGTYTVAGKNLGLKASQFTDELTNEYGSGVASNSLKLTGNAESNWNKVCRYVGEQDACQYQLMRHLGTLGRYQSSWGSSLAVINPGDGFKKESGQKSLLLSGPAQALSMTNDRWDQEGYNPYACDMAGCDPNFPFGTLDSTEANNTKTLMFSGFTRVNGGGSILVTPAGIGKAISSGTTGPSYCSKEWVTVNSNVYSCNSTQLQARMMRWIPDSEDVVFMFNAAKALSATDSYRIVGYYGGVLRGYLAVSVGSELKVQEIAP